MPFLVRLKPFNEKKGYVVRVYMIDGVRFHEERGWYEVPDEFANRLRELHQDHYNDDSPLLFDVCTRKEAERLDAAAVIAEAKASAKKPAQIVSTRPREGGDLTTADIKEPVTPELIEPEEDDEDEGDPDDGRVVEVGRVSSHPGTGPKTRSKKR